jgi:hypothetical protein
MDSLKRISDSKLVRNNKKIKHQRERENTMKVKTFLIILLLSTLACLNSNGGGQPSISPEDSMATSVAATLTAAGSESQPGQAGTQAPPTCQPQHPGTQSLQIPSALAVGSPIDINLINIRDLQGNVLGTKTLAGLTWQDPNHIHFAGGLSGGIPPIPVVFHSLTNGDTLKLEQNGTVSQLTQTSDLLAIAGENGGGNIAYSLYSSVPSGWSSTLYATPYGDAASTQVKVTRNEGDGHVIWPLAVHTINGQAQGVWYTESMYGIGNILFHPYRDLFYLNLTNNQVTSYLGSNTVLAGFSPDQTWAAYGQGSGNSPGQAQGFLSLKNLITCQEVTLPFHASSNLGGGWVIFSPNNQMVAWLEASGPSPMEASHRLRVARIDGTLVVDSPISDLSALVGGETPSWIVPGGWADNHILILEIHLSGYPNPLVVIWAPDQTQPLNPALGANQSATIGDGRYMGFLYP